MDPIGFNAGDNNWYRFVANGPISGNDPLGLACETVHRTVAINTPYKKFGTLFLGPIPLQFRGMMNLVYAVSISTCDVCCANGAPGKETTLSGSLSFQLEARVTAGFDNFIDWGGGQVYYWGGIQAGVNAAIEGTISEKSSTCAKGKTGEGCISGSGTIFGKVGGEARFQVSYWSWTTGVEGGISGTLPISICAQGLNAPKVDFGPPRGEAWFQVCIGACVRWSLKF
jgi:hypothetical protein